MGKMKLYLLLLLAVACSKNDDTPNTTPDGKLPYAVIPGPRGLKYHTGLLKSSDTLHGLGDSHVRFTDCGTLPDSFDLRTMGVVPDIRDQGQCGSCWAFSKTGSLESALLGQGIKHDLSMQELVSCDTSEDGCGGGNLDGFKYQINHGQSLAKDYPYTSGSGSSGRCKSAAVSDRGVSFQYVGAADRGPNEDELKCALYKYKTVPWITVGATNAWGNPPSSEHIAYSNCGASQTNHAVGVVGWWKDTSGKTQFIMKNSWGKDWGDNGYMSLPLGCNSFGDEVAFIEVAKAPQPTPPNPTPTPPGPTPAPTPGPCVTPTAKLPAEVQIFAGSDVMLGVKMQAGVTYTWTDGVTVLGTDAMLIVSPFKDTIYKLTAKSACAVIETQVRVRIVQSMETK